MTDRDARFLEGDGEGADARLAAARDALGDPVTWESPPSSVAEGILTEIRAETSPFPESRGQTATPWRRLLAAAAGMAALVAVLVVTWPTGDDATVVLAGTELMPQATGTAVLEQKDAGWQIRLDVADLPPAEEGYYYEGWVWSDEGEGVSIGTFHLRSGSSQLTLWAGVDVAEYPSIWISRQPEGGGPAVSDEILMRGRIDPDR